MFTGIVEEMGVIKSIRKGASSAVLEIQAQVVLEDVHIGDSIAVNGVCLTATSFTPTTFTADVMHETLNRSSLANLRPGSRVNLERAMAANGRFGGHIVAGHVDGVGTVLQTRKDDNAIWYTIGASPEVLRYVVEKGSITIDGISLTVAKVTDADFSISAIPHTVAVTVLQDRKPGDTVNLETDIIGKYVEKLLTPQAQPTQRPTSNITREFLSRYGY
ncbi:riboflavin synthase [Evtepia sp.]|uniref:riboflavin synthase n=1 Tax=Evtepia sp. TaxID=2773933 RepID=UPI003F14781B